MAATMTTNIDDHTNIFGMDKIYRMGDVDSSIDPSAAHDEFLKSYLGVSNPNNSLVSNSFQNDLNKMQSYTLNDQNYGMQFDQRSVAGTPSKNFMPPSMGGPKFSGISPTRSIDNNNAPISATSVRSDAESMRSGFADMSFSPSRERTMNTIRFGAPAKTEDERVSQALQEMLNNGAVGTPIIPLVTEDDREELLENCISLRDELKETGANVSNIPEPHSGMSKEELERIFRRLRIKNDRKRATTTAEELITLAAKGMGKFFNGKREFFGYKLDARGWDATVKGKFKRMRYDTSTWVSGIMRDYTMSSGMRIGVELVPSLLICLATNKGDDDSPQTTKPTYSDKEWENSIADIADTE
jgi:hypothetical protein